MDLLTISKFYGHHATLRFPDVTIVIYRTTGDGIYARYPRFVVAFFANSDNTLIQIVESDSSDVTVDDPVASEIDEVLHLLCSV
jgi:hypothetical protein